MPALSDSMCCRLPIDGYSQYNLRGREGPQHHISTCEESSPHHFSTCGEGPPHQLSTCGKGSPYQLSACGENLCGSDKKKLHFSAISARGENSCGSGPRKVHFSAISARGETPCGSGPKKSALLGFHIYELSVVTNLCCAILRSKLKLIRAWCSLENCHTEYTN